MSRRKLADCSYFPCSSNNHKGKRTCYGCKRLNKTLQNESYLSEDCSTKGHVCRSCVTRYLEMKSVRTADEIPFETSTIQWIETSLNNFNTVSVKSFDIQSFPRDILLLLMEYVTYQDQVEFICCCRDWYHSYMRKYIRRLTISKWNPLILRKANELLTDPVNQLSVDLPYFEFTGPSLTDICFDKLSCDLRDFAVKTTSIAVIRVRKLVISISVDHVDIADGLVKVVDCQELSLISHSLRRLVFPYLSSVKSLVIQRGMEFSASLVPYVKSLQQLRLYSCNISDVSMFGSIPYLELYNCDQILDISALNNNHSISVKYCHKIQDYSRSFANSQKIELVLGYSPFIFDLSHWKQVENLSLSLSFGYFSPANILGAPQFPEHLKRCHLHGQFVSLIDYCFPINHALRDLKLSANAQITSVEGYSFEQLHTIELQSLWNLKSLRGIGRGRNTKVVVEECAKIVDFSPLQYIAIVEIKRCQGFTDPLQLRFVHDLRLTLGSEISFAAVHNNVLNPYSSIHFLSLSNIKYVKGMEGLKTVPNLELSFNLLSFGHLQKLETFFKLGSRLENIKITLRCDDSHSFNDNDAKLMRLHTLYMKDHYDFIINGPSKKRIWIQKKSP